MFQQGEPRDIALEVFTDEAMRFRNPDLFVILRCGCMIPYCKGWRTVRKSDLDLEPSDITLPVDVQGPLGFPGHNYS